MYSQMQFRLFEFAEAVEKIKFRRVKKGVIEKRESEATPRVPLNGTSNAIKV